MGAAFISVNKKEFVLYNLNLVNNVKFKFATQIIHIHKELITLERP